MPRFKRGAVPFGLHPVFAADAAVMRHGGILDQVFQTYAGRPAIITSANDGESHRSDSLHYSGRALDLRTRDMERDSIEGATEVLRDRLGPGFDVVFEGDHIHIEYDPEEG